MRYSIVALPGSSILLFCMSCLLWLCCVDKTAKGPSSILMALFSKVSGYALYNYLVLRIGCVSGPFIKLIFNI